MVIVMVSGEGEEAEQVLVAEGVASRNMELSTRRGEMSLLVETASEADRDSAAEMNQDREDDTVIGMQCMQEVEAQDLGLLREMSIGVRKVLEIGMVIAMSGQGMVEMRNMLVVARVGMENERATPAEVVVARLGMENERATPAQVIMIRGRRTTVMLGIITLPNMNEVLNKIMLVAGLVMVALEKIIGATERAMKVIDWIMIVELVRDMAATEKDLAVAEGLMEVEMSMRLAARTTGVVERW